VYRDRSRKLTAALSLAGWSHRLDPGSAVHVIRTSTMAISRALGAQP
jgi:hypothetical protein